MKHITARVMLSLLLAAPAAAGAQPARTFKGRLSPVPINIAMQATVAGQGSVTASLVGQKLTIAGTFEGLRSPAMIARLHKSAKPGMRGEAVVELQVTRGVSGTVSATVDLTPQLMADLENRRLFVQIDSEGAPDGNLWGWLFPQEMKR